MILEDKKCLVDGLEHDYDFAGASNGESFWKCTRCSAWFAEVEDSQP